MDKKLFMDSIAKINLKDSDKLYSDFNTYLNLLKEWNEKINLTAITEEDEIVIKHFIDCLTLSKHIKDNSSLIDVGTGAGFPGLPLKIYNNSINLTLLDSLNKRLNFLNEVISEVKLEKVDLFHSRAEDGGKNKDYREKFDYVTARAVANLSTLLEYCTPFLKVGGAFLCMKGPDVDEEVEGAKNALVKLNCKIESIEKVNLPNSDITHSIIIIRKTASTSNVYPRKAGLPSKQPL